MSTRWQRAYDRDDYRCIYCGEPLWEDLRIFHSATEDHLYPRWPKNTDRQGEDSDENVVPACQLCNSLKADYVPAIATNSGVLVQTARGRWEVAPQWRDDYIQQVREKIDERKNERKKLFDAERQRIQRGA